MLVPLLGLILGIILAIYTFLIYNGNSFLEKTPLNIPLKNNKWLAFGLTLISLALMLGIISYFITFSGNVIRLARLILIISGLITVKITLENNLNKLNKLPKFLAYFIKLKGEDFLKIYASILILFLFLKSIVAVDFMSGDTWIYQLPFAARIWGLITKNEYILPDDREILYGHTTMLANFFQGFFWKIFGLQNPQGANLFSFFSLIIFFIFVKNYLKIPFYSSVIAILAVPLIHIAATACYVDLPGNVCVAIAIIMTYLLYIKDDFLNRKNVFIFTLACAGAANIKYLMVPPIFIILSLAWLRIIWLYFPNWKQQLLTNKVKQITWFLGLTLIISLIIFATEFKNIALHGNPFYPLYMKVAGVELNHLVVPSSDYMSPNIQAMSPLQRWIFSLLEINAFDDERPLLWTIAMDYIPLNNDKFGMGGYFAIYVIFNLIIFFTLCRRWVKETKIALILFIIMTLITAFLPFSYQLRYYMYWMITLISLNLYLLNQQQNSQPKLAWLNMQNFSYVSLAILISFCVITKWNYTYPNRMSLAKFMNSDNRVNYEIIAEIKEGEKVCIASTHPLIFLYNSKFHPDKNYLLKYEFPISKEYVAEKCQEYRIINH